MVKRTLKINPLKVVLQNNALLYQKRLFKKFKCIP